MLLLSRPPLVWSLSFLVVGAVLVPPPAHGVDQQLAKLIDEAKATYQPVTPEEVNAARSELANTAYALEQFLIPGSGRGERWKNYLKWQGVQEGLAEGLDPNLAALHTSLDKLRSGADGLQLPVFRRTASAMEKYIDLATIARARDQQAFVDRQLDLLVEYLDRYEAEPSPRARFEIERRLDFLAGIGRATELTTALRNLFNHPNLRAEVSEHFLNRLVADPVDNVAAVRDCILGTSIRGTGHTTGSLSIDTVPSLQRAALVLRLHGVTRSETRGYNSPVVIRSSGTTPFTVHKRIELENGNFWNYPARATATTSTITRSVQKQGGGLGSRVIAKIGEREVAEKKPRANYIAARHAEDRIAENLDEELLPKLQDARYEYETQFKQELSRRNAEPRSVVFSSTDRSLNFDILQAGRGELGAATSPTPFPAEHDLAVRVHETGAANLATAILGGATLSQKTKEGQPKLNVELPKQLRKAIDEAREEAETEPAEDDDREFKPWSMLFRRQRPVTFEFTDNLMKLRLHAARINVGDATYDGWDILVNYGMHVQNGGLTLVRDGEIEVIPTAFDPADGGGLTNRQVGLRGNLAKELNRQADAGRGFPEEIQIPVLELPENLAKHGPLLLQDASSDSGWLSLGWVLPRF